MVFRIGSGDGRRTKASTVASSAGKLLGGFKPSLQITGLYYSEDVDEILEASFWSGENKPPNVQKEPSIKCGRALPYCRGAG